MPDRRARSISPVKAVATGPVISTWPSARHSISSSPPSTTAWRGGRSGRGDARSPAPRRRRSRRPASARRRAPTRAAGCGPAPGPAAKPILARSGNSGSCSRRGPELRDRQRRRRPGTKNVACGLPMLAAAGSATGPTARSRCSVSIGRASGMSGQPSRAGPMSTRTRPSGSASAGRLPAMVRIDLAAPAGLARQQRGDAARGVAAGPGLGAVGVADAHEGVGIGARRWRLDGDELVAADAGAPVGDRGSAALGVRPSGPPRSSSTTKSLPQPCILRKPAMQRI